jgi:hypothetical protein
MKATNEAKGSRLKQMSRQKQIATLFAVVLSVTLALSTTYAWVSISQVASNEASGTPKYGGRIHDDFDGKNKDVYAENYGTVSLFVRVRLNEYMESGTGAGLKSTDGGTTPNAENHATPFATGTSIDDKTTWPAHIPNASLIDCGGGDIDKIHRYITWTLGGSKVFMPTFNKDQSSLSTDASGIAIDAIGAGQTAVGKDDASGDHNDGTHSYWEVGDSVTADESYWDASANSGSGASAIDANKQHTAKYTLIPESTAVMTMAEWKAAGDPTGNFWVYDTDGWAYWANALAPGDATGLLLNGIDVISPDKDWYYCIDVVGQFASASDLSKFGEDGQSITTDAVALLEKAAGLRSVPVEP